MMKYFSDMKISHMLFCGGAAFVLPLAVLLYFILSGFGERIRVSRLEAEGLGIVRPLAILIEYMPVHRHYAHLYFQGDYAIQAKMKPVADRIRGSFSDLFAETGRLENLLGIDAESLKEARLENARPTVIYRAWEKMHAEWNGLSADESDRRHDLLIGSLHDLIARVGDTSNLILDPDLDSYYLMDLALSGIPGCQEAVARAMLEGESLLSRKEFTPADIARVDAAANLIETVFLPRIRQAEATALREDPFYYGESASLRENLPPAFARYEAAATAFLEKLGRLGGASARSVSGDEIASAGDAVLAAGTQFQNAAAGELSVLIGKRIDAIKRMRLASLLLAGLAAAFAFWILALASRRITRPLGLVTAVAGDIAEGNIASAHERLAHGARLGLKPDCAPDEKPARNETARLFRTVAAMTCTLDTLLTQAAHTGEEIAGSASTIASSVLRIEESASRQAVSTNEVNATSREISSTVRELADTMNRVTVMASDAAELASAGIAGLDDIKTTMQALSDSTGDISAHLETFREKTHAITEIITTITRVANQTNMLSLNATIEAEKAGEFGAGFSVVAREISRLADQTAVAALDIEDMILEMQSAVTEGVAGVESYAHRTRISSEKTTRISGDLGKIIEQSRKLGPELEAVNRGMQMQSESASQISQAMDQLNRTAHLTRDSLTDFRDITEHLNRAVQGLQKITHLGENG